MSVQMNDNQSIHDLAVLITTEARGEGEIGQAAVVHTVLNRLEIKNQSNKTSFTVQDIIYTRWQYTGMHPSDTSSVVELPLRVDIKHHPLSTSRPEQPLRAA